MDAPLPFKVNVEVINEPYQDELAPFSVTGAFGAKSTAAADEPPFMLIAPVPAYWICKYAGFKLAFVTLPPPMVSGEPLLFTSTMLRMIGSYEPALVVPTGQGATVRVF